MDFQDQRGRGVLATEKLLQQLGTIHGHLLQRYESVSGLRDTTPTNLQHHSVESFD